MKRKERMFENAAVDSHEYADSPTLRETMEIRVGGKMITVYKDEIEKRLYGYLYERLYEPVLNYGA